MKNTLFIDLDTDREQKVLIGKPEGFPQPTTPVEAAKMINTDIACICEALCSLIHIADQNGYSKKEEMVSTSIKYLNDLLTVKNK